MNPIRPQPPVARPEFGTDPDDMQIQITDVEMGIRATCLEQAVRVMDPFQSGGAPDDGDDFHRVNHLIIARAMVFEHYVKTGELISIPTEQENKR